MPEWAVELEQKARCGQAVSGLMGKLKGREGLCSYRAGTAAFVFVSHSSPLTPTP